MAQVGWRERHFGFTVVLPLAISALTVLLIKPLSEIFHLLLYIGATLCVVFGVAAHSILAAANANDLMLGSGEHSGDDGMILGFRQSDINVVLYAGAGGLIIGVAYGAFKTIRTHNQVHAP